MLMIHFVPTQIDFYCKMNHHPEPCDHTMFVNQGEASEFIEAEARKFMAESS